MKKCTWCGKEYPDEAKVCAQDQQPLESLKPDLNKERVGPAIANAGKSGSKNPDPLTKTPVGAPAQSPSGTAPGGIRLDAWGAAFLDFLLLLGALLFGFGFFVECLDTRVWPAPLIIIALLGAICYLSLTSLIESFKGDRILPMLCIALGLVLFVRTLCHVSSTEASLDDAMRLRLLCIGAGVTSAGAASLLIASVVQRKRSIASPGAQTEEKPPNASTFAEKQ